MAILNTNENINLSTGQIALLGFLVRELNQMQSVGRWVLEVVCSAHHHLNVDKAAKKLQKRSKWFQMESL